MLEASPSHRRITAAVAAASFRRQRVVDEDVNDDDREQVDNT